ncbi:DUF1638 domain-containing protein [Methanococcoides alaskense]|uniref:DUF1638 domain-containing protein n=2 Tax=Methanococcoides alaskense TaxID=325778 RepID=A0AA90TX73_9EURY|nr:DUF1638 domain-containing protein [Methanococcoides alaskense]MDR6221592.1 hypothetical protein [Methanococcoides alaskense]
MAIMNITACRIFEDEVVNVIENDQNIDGVIVVENSDCCGIVQKLEDAGCSHKVLPLEKIPFKSGREDPNRFSVIVNMLELSFHGAPKTLKEEVYTNVKNMANYSDGILLFYGLCGNIFRKLEDDFESLSCPVYMLKEDSGEIVDDCIGAILGGRDTYYNLLTSFNGRRTLLMTPMWILNWREMFRYGGFTTDPDDIETTKFVLDSLGYKTIGKVNTGLSYMKDFENKVDEFAKTFGFDVIEIDGNQELIEKCYRQFKNEMLTHKDNMSFENLTYISKQMA